MGMISNGCYGIPNGLVFSVPVKCKGNFELEIVENIPLNDEVTKEI